MIDGIIESIINYHISLRQPLFISGFTISSFLFSMKTSIITSLKKDIYDTKEYHEKIDQINSLGGKQSYYGSLRKFSNLLMTAIYLSFVSSICNITIGYFESVITALLCLALTFSAWFYLFKAIVQVHNNWGLGFDYAESLIEREKLSKTSNVEKIRTGSTNNMKNKD